MPKENVVTRNAERLAARFSIGGRRALVTGGSVSIGREIVLALAEAGADVAIHHSAEADRSFGLPDAAPSLAAEVAALGSRAAVVEADFSLPGEGRRCVETAREGLGGLDVLVICASIQYREPFLELSEERVERQIQVNFRSTLELLQAALPDMKASGWGRVVTIGSINELTPESDLTIYAALKSAQTNLALNLAKEYAAYGVTINNLMPGLIATERNRWRRQDGEVWSAIQKGYSPTGRAGTPREIAGAALLLCSEAGSYITGANIEATGGAHL